MADDTDDSEQRERATPEPEPPDSEPSGAADPEGSDDDARAEPDDEAPGDAAGNDDQAPARTERRRKKKKKRRRAAQPQDAELADTAPSRAALDADGRERPRFLLSFPDDPELGRLVAAFESGDFATVRADAPALAERTDDESVRDAAHELLRRIEPDPLVKYLLLASVVLLLVLVMHAYTHKP
jgi:hypothetical protein